MSKTIIIDTDILVDVARGNERAASFLDEIKSHNVAAISSVTEMELIVGCENKRELAHLESFLSDFKRIKLDTHISDEAVELLRRFRLSHGLLIADALIAATAKVTGTEFVSKNYKHFRFIPDLDLRKYLP
jgi:predicted nucleic acid-binding protein